MNKTLEFFAIGLFLIIVQTRAFGYNDQFKIKKIKRSPQDNFLKDVFRLSEVVNNVYRPEKWNGTWVSDTEYIFRNVDGIQIFSVTSGQSHTLVPSTQLSDVFQYKLSADQKFILLARRPQKLFRHSFIAIYDIYNIQTGEKIKLQPDQSLLQIIAEKTNRQLFKSNIDQSIRRSHTQLPLLYATWAPTGSAVAYVFSNNIFYRSTPKGKDIAVSTTGIPGTIFNGIADWVYEEEVLSDTRALWFSPDSKSIAWIEFNDTVVDVMPLEIYGRPGLIEFQYPIPNPLRYPKPGRTNPFVNAFVAQVRDASGSLFSPSPILLQPPSYFEDKEKILYAVTWANNNEVSLTWENRHQNYSIVSICNVISVKCRDSLVMTEPRGWLELDESPIFSKNGRLFAMILSSDGFKHVNVINRDTNQRVPITSGEMVVTKIYHWDEIQHVIYFRATRKGAPGERHLYTVTDFETGQPGIVTCLSCDVTNSRGGACGYNSFEFSLENSYYTFSCKGPHVPQDYLFRSPGTKIGSLVTNSDLSDVLSQKYLPKISNLDVSIANGKYTAKVRLYLPHDFSEQKKYPLLVNVYAGPNSQNVNDRFKLDWGTYLTTSEKVIYAVIDGRGSGYRGDDLLFEVYYNIGGPEAMDQIEVTNKLLNLYSFIDKSKVAIWGWSYGGFTTLNVLAEDKKNIFKCGIAVAPVTNWIYYDSIYTERFNGLPTINDNLDGYRQSDITSKAEKLRNKKILIVHGTADDNVHYQQSMMLVRSLEEKDVLFQQLSYPDENHGIINLRRHLYHALSNFILNDCFDRNKVF